MDEFTEGQAVRMAALWDLYRNPEMPENDTVPENDNVCQAATVVEGITPYTTALTGSQDGELVPPGTNCNNPNEENGWCEPFIQNLVWYTNVEPASGCINVEINLGIGVLNNTDLQLALYSVGDCNNFGSFELVAANNNGKFGLAPLVQNALIAPGEAYYIQLDGYKGTNGTGYLEIASKCLERPTNDNVCQAAVIVAVG
jgi:hypothetical protein